MKKPHHLTNKTAIEYWRKYSQYIEPGQAELLAALCNAFAIHRTAQQELLNGIYGETAVGQQKGHPAMSVFSSSLNTIIKLWKLLKLDDKVIQDDDDKIMTMEEMTR